MLFSVAILRRPTCDEAAAGSVEEIIYGPVTMLVYDCDHTAVANRAIAEAANNGKLPGGWSESMYVCGVPYQHFT